MKSCFCFLLWLMMCSHVLAQVPVRDEPHHKVVLENNYVRLIDVHINPKDTTLYHIHAAPSVIVFLTRANIGSQKMGEAVIPPNEVLPAQTSYADYGTKPITHRVYNAGDSIFHVMDIELLNKNVHPDSCAALSQNNLQQTIDEQQVRVYKLTVTSNDSISINKRSCAYLLVCVSGEIHVQALELKPGAFAFFNPNNSFNIVSGTAKATCVLLELK